MPRIAGSAPPDPATLATPLKTKAQGRRHSPRDGAASDNSKTLTPMPFPIWARLSETPRAANADGGAEAYFAAGAGLALIAPALREETPFAGALRQRLALRATSTSAKILRLREDEAALRDAEHFGPICVDPGRAGRLHRLWRAFAAPLARRDADIFARILPLIDAPPTLDADRLGAAAQDAVAHARHPLAAAARAAALIAEALPGEATAEAEMLAWWAADRALAQSLGWGRPAPLLPLRILDRSLRRGDNGRRPRPSDPHWPEAIARAYALAASDVHALAADLGRRSEKLLAVAPKLRAKGAARVIALILSDDVVSPAWAATISGLSDRAARRLFERLVALGAVRELSGRANFRLYGL